MIESEIVAPGSLKAVLSGKHYNRCVRACKMICEAMERLCFGEEGKMKFTRLISVSKKTKSIDSLCISARATESSILKSCTTNLSKKKVKKSLICILVQVHQDGTATATLYQSDKDIRLDVTLKFTAFHNCLVFCYRLCKLLPLCTVLLA